MLFYSRQGVTDVIRWLLMKSHLTDAKSNIPSPSMAYRLPEVARMVGCSKRFLEKQIAAGYLRCLRLSTRCVRIRPQDLENYLESRAV